MKYVLLVSILCFQSFVFAQTVEEIEINPQGMVLPRLTKMDKSMITPVQGQVLFNTDDLHMSIFDGAYWTRPVKPDEMYSFDGLQLPYVSDQGDRLYLGNGQYVIIPGISVAQPVSVSDPEGNTYNTMCFNFGVAGAEYCWMTENLRATKYNDGTPIPDGTGLTNINTGPNVKLMFDMNDDARFTPVYGKLYTFSAATDPKSICPVGYSVPTQGEWDILKAWLGFNGWTGKEAIALKSKFSGWQASTASVQEEDYFGFNMLPTGYRSTNFFLGQFTNTKFWSSTIGTFSNAFRVNLTSINNSMDIDEEQRNQGYSIRCVKVTP